MEYIPTREQYPLSSVPALAKIGGSRGLTLSGVTFVDHPRSDCLTFCERLPTSNTFDPTISSIVLVSDELANELSCSWAAAKLLRVDDPRATFIDTLAYLQSNDLVLASSLLPETCEVSDKARIGSGAIIEAGAQVDANVSIGNGAIIRTGTWLKRGASIADNCVVGEVGINAYIGRDGRRRGFPHAAGVIIEEGASLGAGCVVTRGILTSTSIGARSIIGNLCNIGHGVEIGEDVWVSVGTMIGGHTRIQAGATLAMGCSIRDNITIGANSNVGMGSVVTKSVRSGSSVFGNPARSIRTVKAGPSR